MRTLIGELPRHLYVWVDSKFTHVKPVGFIPAVWFGLVSFPGRMWGCTVLLESGAVYRNLPPHAIAFQKRPAKNWEDYRAQKWNCYGWDFTAIEYTYLRGLRCSARTGEGVCPGEYLFTVAPVGDAFSAAPEQAKEFTFVKLDFGRLTIQPTNNVLFSDESFTSGRMVFPKDLRRQHEIYNVED